MNNDFFNTIQSATEGSGLPPVHLWNPENCGDIDIRIDIHGRWYHEGTPIKRQKLVDLFSSVLKKEGEEYFLVTPVEKCRIDVELAPLLIVEWNVDHANSVEQTIQFKTQQGHWVPLDTEHQIFIRHVRGEDYPIVHIRSGLNALVSRNVYYQLAESIDSAENINAAKLPIIRGDKTEDYRAEELGLISNGYFYSLSS